VAAAARDPRKRLGPFVLLSELGRGGMGVVFRAWDSRLRRVIALKTLLATDAPEGGSELARFEREVEAMARLRHPNIVRIHETGHLGGRRYFVMDLVDGAPFSKRALDKANPLPLDAAIAAVRDAALAVHHANEQGIVHRDMKPGNMLVGKDGHVSVIDFGLARLVDRKTRLTKSNAVMGTPAYMPPEQAGEDDLPVDRRSDVYSLGATLYFALTGEPPFVRDGTFPLIAAVLTEPPVPPGKKNSRIGRDLDAVCLRCLEKKPQDRYATALELAQDLDRYLAGKATLARPRGVLGRLGRSRRGRLAAPAMAALLLAAGIGAYGFLGGSEGKADSRGAPGAAAVGSGSAAPSAPPPAAVVVSGLPSGAQRLGRMRLDGVLGSDPTRARFPLTCVAALPGGRHVIAGTQEDLLRWDLERGDFEVIGRCNIESIATSADGRHAFTVEVNGREGKPSRIDAWDLASTARPLASSMLGPPGGANWASGRGIAIDGQAKLVLTGWQSEKLALFSAEDGSLLALVDMRAGTPPPDGKFLRASTVALSEDGRTALAGLEDGYGVFVARQYAIEDGPGAGAKVMTVKSTFALRRRALSLAISRDGTVGAVGDDTGSLFRLDLAGGKEAVEIPAAGCGEAVSQVAFRADGRVLAGSLDGTLEVVDLGGGAVVKKTRARTQVYGFAFLPGERVAVAGSDFRVSVVDLAAPGGAVAGPAGKDPGHSDTVEVLASSSDGTRVLSGSRDRTLRLWDVATGAVLQTFVGHVTELRAAALSEDGRRAISVAWHSHVDADGERGDAQDLHARLWDTASGARVARTMALDRERQAPVELCSVALSVDGSQAFLAVNAGDGQPSIYHWRTADPDPASPIENESVFPQTPTRTMAGVPGSARLRALAASSDGSVRLVELDETGEPARLVEGAPGDVGLAGGLVTGLAAARHEGGFLGGMASGELCLWPKPEDIAKPVASRPGHVGPVRALAFSPDGRRAVSLGETDGDVFLWSTAPLQKTGSLEFKGDLRPRSVAFPDDRTVLVGTSRGLILRYSEGK
jgi:WD40 repeat protein